MKDSTTGLWMIPVNEETCKASEGFVCKVSLDAGNMQGGLMCGFLGFRILDSKGSHR